jgi:hypothetical protein
MRWARHAAGNCENRNVYRDLVGKPEENRPLARLRRRKENNIKMGTQETECNGVE